MAPKRAAPAKPAAAAGAAAPSSSTEEEGDTSSSDSTTSHEQEVADEEREEKESSSEEESESESEEEEWAAAAEVEEESTEEGNEGEAEPDLRPSSKRVDPLQSNKSPANNRKRASGEIGKSLSPGVRSKSQKTAQPSESREPKSKRIRRVWAPSDQVLILVALAQHRRQHGKLPACGDSDFFESIRERLEDNSCHNSDIKDKVRSLLRRYKSRVVPTTDHDRHLHNLSKDVWGDLSSIAAATGSINGKKQADGALNRSGAENGVGHSENGGRQSGTNSLKEMCEMYPLLAQEVKLLAEVQSGLESSFTRLDAKRALDIEKKLERVKYAELKIESRMVLEVHAPKAKISKKLVSLLAKVPKNV